MDELTTIFTPEQWQTLLGVVVVVFGAWMMTGFWLPAKGWGNKNKGVKTDGNDNSEGG